MYNGRNLDFSFKIEKTDIKSKFRNLPQKVGYKIGKFRMTITPVLAVAEQIYAPRWKALGSSFLMSGKTFLCDN